MLKKRKRFQKLLSKAVDSQIKFYNRTHIFKTYKVSDKVLLNVKNIKPIRSFKKLNYKYYESYEITNFVKKNAYRLRLFDLLKSVHNVFHVFLLKLYIIDPTKAQEQPSIIEIAEEEQ